MKAILILAAFIYSAFSIACEVHLPSHLLILGNDESLKVEMAHTDCSENAITEVNRTLSSVEGKITGFQFSEMLKSRVQDITIKPYLIHVQHLKHLVREQLLMPAGVQMKSSEAINTQNYVALNDGDRVEVECLNCLYGMQQPLNIKVRGFDGTTRSLMVKADFRKMVKAYKYTSFLPAFSEIPESALTEEFTESIPHTDFITNLSELKFYKLNKPVRAGEILRKHDLTALSLVKAGVKTEVVIENELVRLKTSGISRSNGSLGEMVEVFHPQKNKKYLGKVIDINKVLVEL